LRFPFSVEFLSKEAVLIDPKQPRRISVDGAKSNGASAPQSTSPAQGDAQNPKKKKKRKHRHSVFGYIVRFLASILCLLVMLGSVGGVVLAMYVVQVTAGDEDSLDLDMLKLAQTSIIYDKNGNEYDTFSGDNNRIWVALDNIPVNLQHAVVAIEDKDFYNEPGVNVKRTIAAALNEFTGNKLLGNRQGASTIEQQLVKNLTGDNEQNAARKIREIFRSYGMYKRYSKDTVLEAYLNTISLTGTICGMQVAANEYFNKDVGDLSLAECATLASITKNPMSYNPYTNPELLKQRRDHCLALMRQQGYITDQECTDAQNEPITLTESKAATENSTRTSNNSYFTDALYDQLKQDLMDKLGYDESTAASTILSGGLRIYATVDPAIQSSMEQIMLNETDADGNELFPALWHNEEVDTGIPYENADTVQYDENGMPLKADGSSVFGEDDIPVYADDTNTELKTGKGTDSTLNDVGNLVFYESVRTQASMATLDYEGNILALAGGLGEKKYDRGTNRATLPHQTGSSMKPIGAYALALQYKAITYSSLVPDTPFYAKADHKQLDEDYCRKLGLSLDPYNAVNQSRDDVWRDWPSNYSGTYSNTGVAVYSALEQSLNTVAVWVGSMVGTNNIFNFVHDTLGCTYLDEATDADYGPIVLGSQSHGISSVQLAGAYSIFYDGSFTTPHYYTEVDDYQGNVILDGTDGITTTQAISQETAVIMNRLLSNVLNDSQGTARGMTPDTPAKLDAVAKTGTTSNYKDYTFAGLTPYYVTTVWWGFDKPTNMYELGGKNGKPTQYAWKRLMETVEADLPAKEFPTSDNVVQKNFDPTTGAIIPSGGKVGYFTEDNLPDSSSDTTTDDSAYVADAQAAADAAAAADGTAPDAAAQPSGDVAASVG
jgi:penicillin-binding protein 1A